MPLTLIIYSMTMPRDFTRCHNKKKLGGLLGG